MDGGRRLKPMADRYVEPNTDRFLRLFCWPHLAAAVQKLFATPGNDDR